MKLKMLLAAIALCAIGCNADPGARRELALMRAEMQDLEDAYYTLKSRCGEDATAGPIQRNTSEVQWDESQWDESHNGDIIDYPSTSGDNIYQNEYSPSLSPQFYEPQSIPNRQPPITSQTGPEEIDLSPPANGGQSSLNRNSPLAQQASSPKRQPQSQNKPAAAIGSRPADLILVADQTVPMDTDGDGKPDGIQATFALRNKDGKSVIEPAKFVFSLLDPALPNGKQRIGFWEHSTAGAAPMLSLEPEERPEQVFLPWQSGIPANNELLLFVRHTRSDGTALETQTNVSLDASGGLVADNRTRPDNRSARQSGDAPEIFIDTEMLEKNAKPSNRRPLWRATR